MRCSFFLLFAIQKLKELSNLKDKINKFDNNLTSAIIVIVIEQDTTQEKLELLLKKMKIKKGVDTKNYYGIIKLKEEPLQIQKQLIPISLQKDTIKFALFLLYFRKNYPRSHCYADGFFVI